MSWIGGTLLSVRPLRDKEEPLSTHSTARLTGGRHINGRPFRDGRTRNSMNWWETGVQWLRALLPLGGTFVGVFLGLAAEKAYEDWRERRDHRYRQARLFLFFHAELGHNDRALAQNNSLRVSSSQAPQRAPLFKRPSRTCNASRVRTGPSLSTNLGFTFPAFPRLGQL